jgi:hypothetical protein
MSFHASFRRRTSTTLLLILGLAPGTASAQATKLSIDPQHSTVGFRVRHLFTRVSGQFRVFEGSIDLDHKSLAASKVSVTIQAASVDTNVEARDKDLRSKRFFDVEKYPTLTFTSTAITDVSGDGGKIRGLLTIHAAPRVPGGTLALPALARCQHALRGREPPALPLPHVPPPKWGLSAWVKALRWTYLAFFVWLGTVSVVLAANAFGHVYSSLPAGERYRLVVGPSP